MVSEKVFSFILAWI